MKEECRRLQALAMARARVEEKEEPTHDIADGILPPSPSTSSRRASPSPVKPTFSLAKYVTPSRCHSTTPHTASRLVAAPALVITQDDATLAMPGGLPVDL